MAQGDDDVDANAKLSEAPWKRFMLGGGGGGRLMVCPIPAITVFFTRANGIAAHALSAVKNRPVML